MTAKELRSIKGIRVILVDRSSNEVHDCIVKSVTPSGNYALLHQSETKESLGWRESRFLEVET